jgi:hypothetical protein
LTIFNEQILTNSSIETTQIWGKEFPDRMYPMRFGNSYFLLLTVKTDSALPPLIQFRKNQERLIRA